MRASAEFPFVHDGRRIGLLVVQDGDDFEAWPEAAEICHKAAAAVYEAVDAYGAAELPWSVTVRLGGEDEGRLMNKEFRHKDYATNVLSFPLDEEPEEGDEERYIGDIFVCVPVVLKEAREGGKDPAHHLAHMVVHGMLHLVGYDHEDDRVAKVMEALETDILASMDIPNPYEEEEGTA